MSNLFLKAYYTAKELEDNLPEVANLIRELDSNRMKLIRMIERVTEDSEVCDSPEITEKWVGEAEDLVFYSRNKQYE